MKPLLLSYAAYNLWANQQIMVRLKTLPTSVLHTKVRSSFESLYATVLHLLDAENMWSQRINLAEKVVRPSDLFTGDFESLSEKLLHQSDAWYNWVSKMQDRMIAHEIIYYNTKKEPFKQPVSDILLHLFNHSTFHRGQLINIMRQLDLDALPNTDYINWCRKFNV